MEKDRMFFFNDHNWKTMRGSKLGFIVPFSFLETCHAQYGSKKNTPVKLIDPILPSFSMNHIIGHDFWFISIHHHLFLLSLFMILICNDSSSCSFAIIAAHFICHHSSSFSFSMLDHHVPSFSSFIMVYHRLSSYITLWRHLSSFIIVHPQLWSLITHQ